MTTLPKLTTRASWWIAAGIFGLILVTYVVLFVTSPQNRVPGTIAVLVLVVGLVALMLKTVRLDTEHGRIVTTRVFLLRQTLDLASVTKLAVAPNGTNEAMLGLKGPRLRTYVSLLHLSSGVKRSLDPARLTALADAVERFVPPGTDGREESLARLRAQARHLDGGGAPADSPLAPLADSSLAQVGGGVGAAVSIFTLLK